MTNEQILLEFQNLAKEESRKTTLKFEARLEEIRLEGIEVKKNFDITNYNLKPSFSVIIEDVTPDGY